MIILATIYYILKCLFSYWSIRTYVNYVYVKYECTCIYSDESLLDIVRTYILGIYKIVHSSLLICVLISLPFTQ